MPGAPVADATPDMDRELLTYQSSDGLLLAARDYATSPQPAGTVLCLHGLTRNGRDFDDLARRLSPHWRVIVPDQRGRGRSDYDPNPANYNPLVQTADMWTLLDRLEVQRAVVIGTSMGALMAVLMANQQPDRIAGLVLNDAGPEVDPAGLARIQGYVGKASRFRNMRDATEALAELHHAAYPTYRLADWQKLARATFRVSADAVVPDYDPAIAGSLAPGNLPPSLWPVFQVVSRLPALVIRGALSDLLSEATVEKMVADLGVSRVTVPDRGHAPDLTEPAAQQALDHFLNRSDVRQRLAAA
jgi:Predicted hydrolases or acyltransferases (alpha/beta hydrolase superfamily)